MADETGLRVRVIPSSTATPDIDVVVLHGLGGHALKTFQASNKKNWIVDPEFLPSVLPNARILTFGYNSNLFDDVVTSRVVDHAMGLCSELLVERVDCEAMILANARTEYKPILSSTRAIAFLGTPHHGSEVSESGWLSLAQRIVAAAHLSNSRERISQELKPFSDTLRDISQEFIDIAMNFRMRSFAEQKETYLLPFKGNQLIVPQGSATMSHPKEQVIPLAETHESMVKYPDPQNGSYQKIVKQLDYLSKMNIKEANAAKVEAGELQKRLEQLNEPRRKLENEYWLVPQFLSKHFRGRSRLLESIRTELSTPSSDQRRVILTGLGGVGKSELALKYAVDNRHMYEGVFWISARSTASLEQSYAQFNEELKMTFFEWCSKVGRSWLLIIDNLDDPKTFGKPSERIPSNPSGHVIVTTRRKLPLLHKLGTPFQVDVLEEDEATQMLLSVSVNRISQSDDAQTAAKLVNLLGLLPLAIQQCGAFIDYNHERLESYLSSLSNILTRIEPEADTDLQEEGLEDSWTTSDNDDIPQTILTTWEISYSRISEQNPLAASFISLCAFLDSQNITKELLVAGLSPCKVWTPEGEIGYQEPSVQCLPSVGTASNEARIDKAIALVVSYSLLFSARDQQYYFHPVTHYWMLHRLAKDNDEMTKFFRDAVHLVAQGYPHDEFELSYGDFIKRGRSTRWNIHVTRLTNVFEHESLETKCSFSRDTMQKFVQLIESSKQSKHISNSLQLWLNDPELWFWTIYHRFDDLWYDTVPGRDFYNSILQLEYNGTTWSDNLRVLRDKTRIEIRSARGRTIQHTERHRELQMTGGMVEPFLPLKQSESTAENARLISGVLGLILIKIISKWHDRARSDDTATYTDERGIEHVVYEFRTGKYVMSQHPKRNIMTRWVSAVTSKNISTIELLCVARMANLFADISGPGDSLGNLRLRETALRIMVPNLGFENQEVTASCLAYLTRMITGESDHSSRIESFMQDLLPQLNSTNFKATFKAIEYWSFNLQKRRNFVQAQEVLLNAFFVFWNAPPSFRVHWTFATDPVLDICETLMVFYHDCRKRRVLFAFMKGAYIYHFEQRYGSPFQRLCLGCGVGVLGMSFGRMRIDLVRGRQGLSHQIVIDNTEIMGLHSASNIPIPERNMSLEQRRVLFTQAMAEEESRTSGVR